MSTYFWSRNFQPEFWFLLRVGENEWSHSIRNCQCGWCLNDCAIASEQQRTQSFVLIFVGELQNDCSMLDYILVSARDCPLPHSDMQTTTARVFECAPDMRILSSKVARNLPPPLTAAFLICPRMPVGWSAMEAEQWIMWNKQEKMRRRCSTMKSK